ncbi:MAG: hypothetical protein J5629_10505 [Muribaculaceae bacterium]|nr:hypothetical protein [Muribaculaceae bacterium]
MNQAKLLMKHAFILDVLCLVLCLALLVLGTKEIVPNWLLLVGTVIALVALVASIFLFVKARKIDRAESRRIEAEILQNAAKEDAVDKAIEDGDLIDEPDGQVEEKATDQVVEQADDQSDYKTDEEQ